MNRQKGSTYLYVILQDYFIDIVHDS
jgi:hypothetical protein